MNIIILTSHDDGTKLYFNSSHIQAWSRAEGDSATIIYVVDSDFEVKETPEEIEKKIRFAPL